MNDSETHSSLLPIELIMTVKNYSTAPTMTLNIFIVFLKCLTTLTPVVTNMAQCYKTFLSVIYKFSQKS